jgi:hypothetical protein
MARGRHPIPFGSHELRDPPHALILRTLYMKSNGDILYNDDYGERIRLGRGTCWCLADGSAAPG